MTRARRIRGRTAINGLLAAAQLVGALCALSCNEDTPPPQPARFNRPNRVDFVCVNGAQVVPRADCASAGEGSPLAPHALVTQAGRGEVAVVNLRTRQVIDSRRDIPGYTFIPVGEMPRAIVAPPKHPQHVYVANFGSRDVRVLRTRALVATVTEKPDAQRVALSVDGGKTLLAPTDMVLSADEDESALLVAVPDPSLPGEPPKPGLVLRLPIRRCDTSADPDCGDGLIDESAITTLELIEPAPAAPVPTAHPRYEQLCNYQRPSDDGMPDPEVSVTPVDPPVDGALASTPARPSALALDTFCPSDQTCPARLLVADSAQPLIHVIDLDAWAAGASKPLLPPLLTGVPTQDVVATPRVPRDIEGKGETHYVYAIDANDGSVLVLEDGQLLNVNEVPGQRADRLLFDAGKSGAAAIEVLTPGFDVQGPAAQYVRGHTDAPPDVTDATLCTDRNHEEQDPARLRGVFLAAALTDGTVHVIDVHDMELQPSDRSDPKGPCRQCAKGEIPVLIRNHERVAISFVPLEDEPAPSFAPSVAPPTFFVEGVGFGVRSNGSTASPRAPGLACIPCADGLTRAYPIDDDGAPAPPRDTRDAGGDAAVDGGVDAAVDGGVDAGAAAGDAGAGDAAVPSDDDDDEDRCQDALLCVAHDPWSSGEDQWAIDFEGTLPGASDLRGRFVPADADGNQTGGLELMTDADPCRAGVLGEEDIAPDYGDPALCPVPTSPAGDQVVIRTLPLGSEYLSQLQRGDKETLELCAELRAELEAEPRLRVAFEIRRAYSDRLVVRSALVRPIGNAKRFEDISVCYEDAVNFDVRSQQAFTVRGSDSGFQHHVVTNSAGRCQVDPDGDALRVGRARVGCPFRNHSLQFQLGAEGVTRSDFSGVELRTGFSSSAIKLTFRGFDLGFGSATVVPVQLRYSETDQKLYLIDIHDRGLLPIPLDSFPIRLSSAEQYN
jgi:hypothetical protein